MKTKIISLILWFLICEAMAIRLNKEFEDDEGDKFMEESIKEAEKEVAKTKSGEDSLRSMFAESTEVDDALSEVQAEKGIGYVDPKLKQDTE